MASASDVVKIANQEATLAIKGRPNKYTRWYGFTDEWCAMFVSWCLNQAGVPTSVAPKTAAVSGFLDFAKKNNRYYSKTSGYKPKPGDIMIQKNGCSHTGLVVSASGNSFTTVEGNSSNAVKTRNYTLSSNALSGFFSPVISELLP